MPPRKRRQAALRRRWPLVLLFAVAVLAGVALWAYAPSLPPEMLIARYANDQSKFIDVGGVRAHVRDQGNPDGIPVVLVHGSMGSLHMWEGWVRELGKQANDAKAVLQFVGQTNEELKPFTDEIVKTLEIKTQQADVNVKFQLSQDLIEKAIKKVPGQ